MSRGPERRQITSTVGSPIKLGMSLEEIETSEVQLLVDGDVRETREVSTDDEECSFVFRLDSPGEYSVEMIAEGRLPEEMEQLQQQDALDFSPPKAHATWDVTVESSTPRFGWIGQVWRVVANVLVLREIVSIVRGRWGWVRERLRRSGSGSDDGEEEEVNRTLDEFREE